MAAQTYTIYNLSTDTTATINYITIATTLTQQQHFLNLTGWLPPFNSYTAFTGSSTIRTENKTYISDESDVTKTTTATTTGTTLFLNNNTDIGNGWEIFNNLYITSGQTVASTPGTNQVIMSAPPNVVPFSSGTAITFIPPEYLLTVNNTSNLEVGWVASGNGYNGQTIEEIRGGGVLKMSDQPSTNPSPGGSITFTSNEDVMLEILPLSSSTFSMDYTRVTPSYGTYTSRVNIYGDLAGSFNKVVNNFMVVSSAPVLTPESPFFDPGGGGDGAGSGPGSCGPGSASADGCSCFTSDTRITMADGTKKQIIDICEGDLVQGLTGINRVSKILDFEFSSNTLYGFNGREPFVTACHPIKTDRGWAAFDPELLKVSWPDDWKNLVNENNGPVEQINEQSNLGFWENGSVKYQAIDKILTINTSPGFKVYNLVVTNDHTFIAEDLVVHNKCFEVGTRVLLADGTVKNIEDVEVGEYLLGEHNCVNKVREYHRPLLGLKDNLLAQHGLDPLRMISINGGLFRASEDHLFKTPEGWKAFNNKKSELIHADMLKYNSMSISELKIGDSLITNTGELISVEHIQVYGSDDPNLQLYNFKLTGNNTYYVELFKNTFVLVHNKGECFKQGTLISMADGTFKEIENILVGDRVLSADGMRVNTVKYVEHSPTEGTSYQIFYAPKGLKPFATENHPIVVGDKWVSADAKLSQKLYPWIDTVQIDDFDSEPTNHQVVWNIWVDGDHTYQVNGFGTHSLVDDGGWARISVEQGYMTKAQITQVTHAISNSSSEVAYGALLLSNLVAWLDRPWLTKYVADMMLGKKSKLPMNAAIISVGTVAMIIRKVKRIFKK